MKKMATLRHREVLKETLQEFQRKGNYVCVYPAQGSNIYDQFFPQIRTLNRFLYKTLFQGDFIESLRVPKSKPPPSEEPTQTQNKRVKSNNFSTMREKVSQIHSPLPEQVSNS